MRTIISFLLVLAALPGSVQAFELQGHRGARGLAPENTIPGFQKALEVGVNTLELDLVMSKDGHILIGHDPVLGGHIVRDESGQWISDPGPRVYALEYAEIKKFDVGRINPNHRYARQFADQTPADGTRMPTLGELSTFLRERAVKNLNLNIETKINPLKPEDGPRPENFIGALIELLNKTDLRREQKITLQSFDWRTLRLMNRRAPDITTACLTAQQSWLDNVQVGQPGASPWTDGLDVDDHGGSVPRLVKVAGCKIWSPHFRDLTPARLAEARALGLRTIVWTVNEPGDIRAMLDLGVDGIISDYPDRVHQDMAARGMALPASLRP